MSLQRSLRFFVCLLVSVMLLGVILPYAGIPKSHFLPPSWSYKNAKGITSGEITAKKNPPSGNWFKTGVHEHLIDYDFSAPDPNAKGKEVPYLKYHGEISVERDVYNRDDVNVGSPITIRYEKTYPWINGVVGNQDENWQGIGEGSNILSGWLLWLLAALALGTVFLLITDQIAGKEDI